MLENVADGFLGLFMFFAQWLSPATGDGDIRIAAVKELDNQSVLECIISIEWNEQMNDLIDAGIPITIRIISFSESRDTTQSLHTLACDITDYTYSICDSLLTAPRSMTCSRKYRHIYRAVKEYRHFSRTFPRNASELHIEAVLLPSRVNQLNRSVDISEICNCRTFSLHMLRKGQEH